MTKVTDYVTHTLRELSITNMDTKEKRVVQHYQYLGWLEEQSPSNPAEVVDLIEVLQKSQQVSGGPVIAHDR